MDSTVTNSLNFSNLESPKSNSSSLFNDSLFRWKRTPEKSYDDEEYGGIEQVEYLEPFVIKFHNISSGERVNGQTKMDVVCQLDDFIEVPIADAGKCLDCMTDDRILLDNVEIEIKICAPTSKIAIENVLTRFLERRERCQGVRIPVKRLVFFIYDFTYAKELAPILARIAPNCAIFNLGIPKMKTYPLQPTTESRYVAEFISLFLAERNACETLRILHIFNFVSLDPSLQKILRKCRKLRHLTFSNIDDVGLFELESIESVLLDSCDFSITMFDEMFAEKHPRLFPNATTFGFLRCPVTLALKAVKQWAADRIADNRTEIDFYHPERDFRKFLFEASKSFELVSDDKELEGEVQIKGHIGGPLVTVFNKDRVYKARRIHNNND
ncbi:CBN-HIM-19 protein [Caenorhabditis brenneri]|uniref:CBN-HIM-19 protein n=1 Tax=Caenorhabditis brenneri TaxID=135651 RepID=G0NVA3_CAEBE|nr:CBN-HIM-19 protein [Caenorhabditis brenneri]